MTYGALRRYCNASSASGAKRAIPIGAALILISRRRSELAAALISYLPLSRGLEIGGAAAECVQYIVAIVRDHDNTRPTVIRDFDNFAKVGAENGISGNPFLPDGKMLHMKMLRHRRYGQLSLATLPTIADPCYPRLHSNDSTYNHAKR